MFCCLETAQKGVGIERKCVLSELSNLWERGRSYMISAWQLCLWEGVKKKVTEAT